MPRELRWFTRRGEVESGPFTADEIARSLSAGWVRILTPVRAEGDTDWHPLVVVPALEPALRALPPGAAKSDDEAHLRSLDEDSKLEFRLLLVVAFVPIVAAACYLLFTR